MNYLVRIHKEILTVYRKRDKIKKTTDVPKGGEK